jgi:hypothetical protein
MSPDASLETRASEAQQQLLARCLFAPEVSLIDTGADPGTGDLVLQVHVRTAAAGWRLGRFEDVSGIAVRVIADDYDLEV